MMADRGAAARPIRPASGSVPMTAPAGMAGSGTPVGRTDPQPGRRDGDDRVGLRRPDDIRHADEVAGRGDRGHRWLVPAATGCARTGVLADDRPFRVGVGLAIASAGPARDRQLSVTERARSTGMPMRLGVTTSPAGGGCRSALAEADRHDVDRDDRDGGEHDDADPSDRDRTPGGLRSAAMAQAPTVARRRRDLVGAPDLGDLAGEAAGLADLPGRRGGGVHGLGQGRVRSRARAPGGRGRRSASGPAARRSAGRRPASCRSSPSSRSIVRIASVGREVQVHDGVRVQDHRGQRFARRGERSDPVAQGRRGGEEQRPGEADDEDARRSHAPRDCASMSAKSSPARRPSSAMCGLAARRKTLNAAISAATPTPTSVPYSTTQAAATIAMAPSLGWIRQIRAISPALMKWRAPARTIAPRAGMGKQGQRPGQEQQDQRDRPGGDDPGQSASATRPPRRPGSARRWS